MHRLTALVPLLIAAALIYFPVGGWKLILGGEEGGSPEARTYGATHDVPGFHWVVVLNPDGVDSADTHIGFWEQCLIRYRGAVTEVTSHFSWYATLSGDTLVEYANPAGTPATGVLCPDGTVFMLPDELLAGFNARFAERVAREDALAEAVEEALASAYAGESFVLRDSFEWVEVVNPEGVENYGYDIAFLDVCGIEAGGTVREIQRTAYGSLYRYTPSAGAHFRGVGIPCPGETVFFLEGDPVL